MSSTSIEDQGYTPPDFLEKLFRKTSTTASENTFKPLSTTSNFSSTSYFPSSPLILTNQIKFSPSKLLRTHSFVEDQRISTKKFKIFYNAFMEGSIPEVQASEIWQKFEKSLSNPFEYDRFIEQLRTLKENQRLQIHTKQIQKSDLTADKNIKASASCQKIKQKRTNNWRSVRKLEGEHNNQKQRMKKTISHLRTFLRHGEKYIRGK